VDPTTPVLDHIQHVPEDAPPPDKDVFVKVRLDQGEGAAPSSGRYSLFYNSYWVHKEWASSQNNVKLLAEKFPAFVMFSVNSADRVFPASVYGDEASEKLQYLAADYFVVAPLIKMRNNQFRFSGVKMPTHYSTVTGEDNTTVLIMPHHFIGVAAYYYGLWATNARYENIASSALSAPNSRRRIARWVKKKHKEIDDWLDCTIPELQVATIN
jgi:hypothetical protein